MVKEQLDSARLAPLIDSSAAISSPHKGRLRDVELEDITRLTKWAITTSSLLTRVDPHVPPDSL
jgi:hypothetical protein